jgi:hypothetical protein
MTIRRKISRALRELAHCIDPQPPQDARPGVPYIDFTRGEAWLDGERVSRCKPPRRKRAA